jgi:hypothetical protein
VVTNEQLYLIVSIPMLSNALLWALGFAFLERQSAARDKRYEDSRNRRRAELRGGQAVPGATGSQTGGE